MDKKRELCIETCDFDSVFTSDVKKYVKFNVLATMTAVVVKVAARYH